MYSVMIFLLATYIACGVLVTALMVFSHLHRGGKAPSASDVPHILKAVMVWPEQLLGWRSGR